MLIKYLYLNELIEFEVIYRKRRTMCIKIEENGIVKVIVPIGSKEDTILKAVKPKSAWIISKRKEVLDRYTNKVSRTFKNGDTFMYLGIEYPITIEINKYLKEANILFESRKFIISTPNENEEYLKRAMELWYRKETLNLVIETVSKYQMFFNTTPSSIKVKEQKRRWASCTYKRGLLFNWRISMAPREVLEYIVVHEMCHMVHMNHSKDYWNEVKNIMPNYNIYKKWLKEEGFKMII